MQCKDIRWFAFVGKNNVDYETMRTQDFLVTIIMFPLTIFLPRASREEMSAAASMGKSESIQSGMKSGLVGNIQGQDVEAAKQVWPLT